MKGEASSNGSGEEDPPSRRADVAYKFDEGSACSNLASTDQEQLCKSAVYASEASPEERTLASHDKARTGRRAYQPDLTRQRSDKFWTSASALPDSGGYIRFP
jgi:hypothetical protein